MPNAYIAGTGQYLPEQVLTNADLEERCNTTDEWVRKRTGICQRHIARDEDGCSDIALPAAQMALDAAGVKPEELDLVLCCTVTPDQPFPATANLLQGMLGATNAASWDINAACSGFLCGLGSATAFIESGMYKNVLIVGAELASYLLTWKNRDTAVLFGDGAGAVVLRATDEERGVLSMYLGSDGANAEVLHLPIGGSKVPITADNVDDDPNTIYMDGKELFKRAVYRFVDAGDRALKETGLSIDDIALFVPHQANIRIIEAATERMGMPMERTAINLDRVGNTVAASIPMALHEANAAGRIAPGDHVLLAGFGAGLTWGSSIIRW